MASLINGCATYVALALATAAAIVSAPGHADKTYQNWQWLELSFGAEAIAMSGAVGEHPEALEAR